jgi:hypothetical protein
MNMMVLQLHNVQGNYVKRNILEKGNHITRIHININIYSKVHD